MARAQDEWVVKKIPGSGVACGVVPYGATAVLRSALVLKGALQYYLFSFNFFFFTLLDISKINDYSVICQKHFKEDCINISGRRNRLIEGAVPSEFVCKDIYNLWTL
jgi:hypothetical protein